MQLPGPNQNSLGHGNRGWDLEWDLFSYCLREGTATVASRIRKKTDLLVLIGMSGPQLSIVINHSILKAL